MYKNTGANINTARRMRPVQYYHDLHYPKYYSCRLRFVKSSIILLSETNSLDNQGFMHSSVSLNPFMSPSCVQVYESSTEPTVVQKALVRYFHGALCRMNLVLNFGTSSHIQYTIHACSAILQKGARNDAFNAPQKS